MKKKPFSFSKDDKRIIKLLVNLGITKNIAKIITLLFHVKETISVQIERYLNLRQPEVSVALRSLEQKGWIAKTNIKKRSKGRPTYAYKPAVTPKIIVKKLERNKIKEMKKNLRSIELLKRYTDKVFG